jgi:hypothetical protein
MMTVRIASRALVLGATCLVLVGCEPGHSWSRRDKDDEMMSRYADKDDSSSSKVIGGNADDVSPATFFKKDRSSGGWSSTAREIERNLGAP